MYYIYVIRSTIDSRLYKGITNDLDRRIKEHDTGKNRSTKAYRPWELVYFEKVNSKAEARNREKFFKSGIGRDFLKRKLDP
ncbi:MAG: GIY-YIG nuclease family protein [Bacteroidetes bacterium]|nr:GIY-YIG nuclease family protein [Bacteroidota bacterium]